MKKLFAAVLAFSAISTATAQADVIDYGKTPVDYEHYLHDHKGAWMADVLGVKAEPDTYRFVNSYIVSVYEDSAEIEEEEAIGYHATQEPLSTTSIRKFTHIPTKNVASNTLWNVGTANTKSEVALTKEAKSVNWIDGAGQATNYLEDNHTKVAYETSVKSEDSDPSKLYVHLTFTVERDVNRAYPTDVANSATVLHTYNKDAIIDPKSGQFHSGRAFGYSVPVTFKIHDEGDANKKLTARDYTVDFVINTYTQDGVEKVAHITDDKNDGKTAGDKDELF